MDKFMKRHLLAFLALSAGMDADERAEAVGLIEDYLGTLGADERQAALNRGWWRVLDEARKAEAIR